MYMHVCLHCYQVIITYILSKYIIKLMYDDNNVDIYAFLHTFHIIFLAYDAGNDRIIFGNA